MSKRQGLLRKGSPDPGRSVHGVWRGKGTEKLEKLGLARRNTWKGLNESLDVYILGTYCVD